MAGLKDKSAEILQKFKDEGRHTEFSLNESARVTAAINNEMRIVKRDFNKKEIQSLQAAEKIILTA